MDLRISIHAPRVGSDVEQSPLANTTTANFNPRSPRGERPFGFRDFLGAGIFQSTLPAWGATKAKKGTWISLCISIHAPRVGSDLKMEPGRFASVIFQSTLPAWGATLSTRHPMREVLFQSTLPAWGATGWDPALVPALISISIHAPRVGSDSKNDAKSILLSCRFCELSHFSILSLYYFTLFKQTAL